MTVEENDDRILFEAAGWMAKLTDGPLPSRDKKAFQQWLKADANHRRAMQDVETQWRQAGKLAGFPASAERTDPRRDWISLLFRFRGTTPVRLALAVPIAALLAVLVLLHPFRSTVQYDTAVGERRQIMLEDGSQIRLNTGTSITVVYDFMERRVILQRGEADFTVVHKAWNPFLVDTGHAQILVTGTHFLVREEPRQTQTFLTSGAVELRTLSSHESLAKLKPGNLATVTEDEKVRIEQSDGVKESAWMTGKVVFNHTSLDEALAEFQRYTPVSVTLSSEALRSIQISGVYATNDLFGFLDTLSTLHPLHIIKTAGNNFVIESPQNTDEQQTRKN
ncbi:FecR domain-containing protein [Telmatospirillum sp.]|uniref:FecR family protein n=1 Tax=Telmatospirillum sp. TaxID=2079197 RepID=UPI002851D5A4|nr:FecR domain-containing protein [Telmatospirillum sp.]MDR3438571.1 FecR domain-containing protein [Telmatospirillum sp.]